MNQDTGSGYRHYTDEEVAAAAETDLPDLLTSLGYQVKRVGSYFTVQEMDSLRIKNRRSWYRYSEQKGGDAITFLQHFHGKSFIEAVSDLLAFQGRAAPSRTPNRTPSRTPKPPPAQDAAKEKSAFTLPQPNNDSRRVFAYLRKRGIASQVINGFLKACLLYEDAPYHNCVFVGRNAAGKPVFATRRGTYDKGSSSFKGDVSGSDKNIAFRLPARPDNDSVLVFESPIDMMSYCTLQRQVTGNAVALCGLHDGALETYLRDNPGLKKIVLCLDVDEPGQEASFRLAEKYKQKGYQVSMHVPSRGKDWNEYLQLRQQTKVR